MESISTATGPLFVLKRDNLTRQPFDSRKIKRAIIKAWSATDPESLNYSEVRRVVEYISSRLPESVNVEQVQKEVELALIKHGKSDIAERYIAYRLKHDMVRAARLTPDPKAIADYIHVAKYSRYIEELGRRETFDETVSRVELMHMKRFPQLMPDISNAFDMVRNKEVFPSMRSMQFGGLAIEKNNCRQYNCSFTLVDRLDAFSGALYLLLCGCGVGFSVQKQHVEKLPRIEVVDLSSSAKFTIEDSIEGWADALKVLLLSYTKGVDIEFDYSKIRPAGSPLKTSGGKAPGPDGLREALQRIRLMLIGAMGRQLTPIEAYDIMCHAADAVLSGGIRRSAMIALFSIDDEEMMNAKASHDWFEKTPWRANSNNSVALLRGVVTREEFSRIFISTKAWGEPGVIFLGHSDHGTNPCQPGWATVLTPDGIRTFDDICVGSTIWTGRCWTKVVNKQHTGVKPIYGFHTRAGVFYGTDNHRVVSNGSKLAVSLAESIDIAIGGAERDWEFDTQAVMDGIVLGDGMIHKASNNLRLLVIGDDDVDYHSSEVAGLIGRYRPGVSQKSWEITTTIEASSLVHTYDRTVPDKFRFASEQIKCSFLRGLYTANGSVIAGQRVALKASSHELIMQIQEMLSSVGIRSYYTVNKPTKVAFSNGDYVCRQSYDLNITSDRDIFMRLIGFIQGYKMNALKASIDGWQKSSRTKSTYEITDKEYLGEEAVYDITVEDEEHVYWTGGLKVSNCGEIGLDPRLFVTGSNIEIVQESKSDAKIGDTVTGFAFCNLTEINAAKFKTLDDFKKAAKTAALIGTLQAAYTDFPYLGVVSEEIARRDALLGVSMTGVMDNPDIACNPEYQRIAAEEVVFWNAYYAQILGINSAARSTCIKPAGTSSLVFEGIGSGHHLHHSRRYFRRVTANEIESVFQHFKSINPHMCVKKPNGDWVIEFVIEAPASAKVKADMGAIEFLDSVKSTQVNWVVPGTSRPDVSPGLTHNVSNTVHVKANEWDDVEQYLWDNQQYLTGVSLLPDTADKLYAFAPNESVLSDDDEYRWNEIIRLYKPVDYTAMIESDDNTNLKGELACSGGSCELRL